MSRIRSSSSTRDRASSGYKFRSRCCITFSLCVCGCCCCHCHCSLFLRKLKLTLKIPVLALVDSDPYGLKILSVYMKGSMNMSYDSSNLTTPDIKWLGVRPSDLDRCVGRDLRSGINSSINGLNAWSGCVVPVSEEKPVEHCHVVHLVRLSCHPQYFFIVIQVQHPCAVQAGHDRRRHQNRQETGECNLLCRIWHSLISCWQTFQLDGTAAASFTLMMNAYVFGYACALLQQPCHQVFAELLLAMLAVLQLQEDFIRANPLWVAELELMLKTKEKAEIQALSSFGFQYLSQVYLPLKLQEGDWI